MDRHFGIWLKKVREKLRMNQIDLAERLGLRSYQAIYRMEERKERSMRGQTLESLLSLLGYEREEELDRDWQAGRMPDLDRVRKRIGRNGDTENAMHLGTRRPVLPRNAAHLLERYAAEAGIEPAEWLNRLLIWLANQPETWRSFVAARIAATPSDVEFSSLPAATQVDLSSTGLHSKPESPRAAHR